MREPGLIIHEPWAVRAERQTCCEIRHEAPKSLTVDESPTFDDRVCQAARGLLSNIVSDGACARDRSGGERA